MLNQKQREFLLKLARDAIEYYLKTGERLEIEIVDQVFLQERAVFVTLTEDGELRGCIGHILPIQELYQDVIENAINAATGDPRFSSMQINELDDLKIEISLLSLPEEIKYKNTEDLLNKINHKMGIIIEKDFYHAVFLPQVWEQLPKKEEFLSYLCRKAGLSANHWQKGDLIVKKFTVENFEED